MSRSGWFGKRAALLTAGGAALVLAAGVAIVAVGASGSHAALVSAAHHSTRAQPAPALQVLSVTPAAGAQGVNGTDPIRVQFSAPLAASTPMPQLSPQIAGGWQIEGDTAVFTPAVGYFQDTRVTLKFPGGPAGMISVGGVSADAGGLLASGVTQGFTTGSFSTLRLQELLAQLGYLPLTWTPASSSVISPGSV